MNKAHRNRRRIALILTAFLLIEVVVLAIIVKKQNNDRAADVSTMIVNSIDKIALSAEDSNYSENLLSGEWNSDVNKILERYADNLPQGYVIFYGSSSIRKWKTLEEDMPGLNVLNHGFGGSKVADCLRYADRLLVPFCPASIVLYVGTNDIGKGASAAETYETTVSLIEYIHGKLPGTRIYYVEQTRQPKRDRYWEEMQILNSAVRDYSEADPLTTFVQTSDRLNNEDGSSRKELFTDDGIHFNEEGYRIWAEIIRAALYKDLPQ